jgi:hypothetical protein
MHDLCIFLRFLVSITQIHKDTEFGLDNWYECPKTNAKTRFYKQDQTRRKNGRLKPIQMTQRTLLIFIWILC